MRLLEQFFGPNSQRLYLCFSMEHGVWSTELAPSQAFFDILKIKNP